MDTHLQYLHKYCRVSRDNQGVAQTLETAIVRFGRSNRGWREAMVDLIAAIHFGEKSYYDKLDEVFEQYDVVLYEGILPRKRQFLTMNDRNPFIMLNRSLAGQLQLEYQPDCINYRRANFEHADLLLREYRKSVRRRHEHSLLGLPVPVELKQDGVDQQEFERMVDDDLADMYQRYLTAEPGLELRRMFVAEFLEVAGQTEPILFSQKSTLLTERNQVALRALTRQLKRNKKRLAIFYGCAHMPDFESHLSNDFAMQRVEEHWLVAWDMRTPPR